MGTSGANTMDDSVVPDDDDAPPSSVAYTKLFPFPPAAAFSNAPPPPVTAFTKRNIPPVSFSNTPYSVGESDLDTRMPFLRVANDDDSPSSARDALFDSYRRLNSSHTVVYSARDNADVL
jgi:hypothetical protein